MNVLLSGAYAGIDWDAHKERFIDEAIRQLSAGPVPELVDAVDFERRIGLGQGGLHGIVQDAAHMTVFRPSNRSKSVEGLYLAGSSTTPGGGVPTVIASGLITARLVERYQNGARR